MCELELAFKIADSMCELVFNIVESMCQNILSESLGLNQEKHVSISGTV